MEGHLEGMLDRDQRTAKLRLYENYNELKSNNKGFAESSSIETNQNKPVSHCGFPRRPSPYSSYFTNKKGHRSSIQRLKRILIVGAYLTVLTLPSTLAAPKDLKMSKRLMKWQDPCGDEQNSEQTNSGQYSEHDQLASIITEANTALNRAKQFKKEFLDSNFKINNSEEIFKNQMYEWLPALPKKLGENVTDDHLRSLEIQKALLDTSEYLQRVAVGIEQVVKSQREFHGKFFHQFIETEQQLLQLLCELQTAIKAHNMEGARKLIDTDIMDENLKNTQDITTLKLRDWIIYREYMNCLEYIIEVFSFLKNQL